MRSHATRSNTGTGFLLVSLLLLVGMLHKPAMGDMPMQMAHPGVQLRVTMVMPPGSALVVAPAACASHCILAEMACTSACPLGIGLVQPASGTRGGSTSGRCADRSSCAAQSGISSPRVAGRLQHGSSSATSPLHPRAYRAFLRTYLV
jgi:hypothetical protein